MLHFRISSSVLVLALLVTTTLAFAGPQPCDVEGLIGVSSIGGVETPRREAFAIGAQRFLVSGPMAPAVQASVGQHLAVRGLVCRQVAIGGEALPRFEVGELRLTRCDITQSPVRVIGPVQVQKDHATVGQMSFVAAGPLAGALGALSGLEVELTGIQDPAKSGSLLVTSIGRRDLTKRAGGCFRVDESVLETLSEDAIGRYSLVHPGTPSGVCDGAGPKVKSAGLNKATGNFEIVVETFGGVAGMSLGNEILYVYDSRGAFMVEKKVC
ncbi:MAG: hypothetical protein HY814_11910 [Candidatus Riflebacteria bacterium]|nr:hypothetical protein [Candidatus Riflebacteria bacterium]